MKLRTITLLGTLVLATAASAQQSITLNGTWQLELPESTGIRPLEVSVPHTYNVTDGLEEYAREAAYSRTFRVPKEMKGKRLRLHFGSVYHSARVSVNGQEVGQHDFAGYTPFSFDITPMVNP